MERVAGAGEAVARSHAAPHLPLLLLRELRDRVVRDLRGDRPALWEEGQATCRVQKAARYTPDEGDNV